MAVQRRVAERARLGLVRKSVDTALAAAALEMSTIRMVPERLTLYRVHLGSTSATRELAAEALARRYMEYYRDYVALMARPPPRPQGSSLISGPHPLEACSALEGG
ncbi:hypothetical protein [Acidilobus sp.]|uniref:hypothetical protein n=1 Tax=Acidilobus sp. TaxID=1872109 RepID=UPI003CFBCFFD